MDLIADTTFLVGLWRRQPWAVEYARSNAHKTLGLPWVVLGEFWHGANSAGDDPDRVRAFLAIGLPMLDTEPAIQAYAGLCARMMKTPGYREIGQNDLWIAAVCLAHGLPLVSRNKRHFDRIKGLRLEVLQAT